MPHGKSKQSRNNKKKSSHKKKHNSKAVAPITGSRNETTNEVNRHREEIRSHLEDLRAFDDTSSPASSEASDGGRVFKFENIYARYKQATKRFQTAVRRKLPENQEDDANWTCDDLMDAVDYLANKEVVIEKELMSDLKVAITSREKANDFCKAEGTNDEGHEHFLRILKYCWAKLRRITTVRNPTKQKQDPEIKNKLSSPRGPDIDTTIANRFEKLHLEGDDSDGEDEDLTFETPPLRPKAIPCLSLEELCKGSDREDAALFLAVVDTSIKFCAKVYTAIKMDLQETKRKCNGELSSYELVNSATLPSIYTNYAIQLITALEQYLIAEYPHLNTPYRTIALIRCPGYIEQLTQAVIKESPPRMASQFTKAKAVEYVGDAIELGFRAEPAAQGSVKGDFEALAASFARQWKMPMTTPMEIATTLGIEVLVECPMKPELTLREQIAVAQAETPENDDYRTTFDKYTWFEEYEFLTGKWSIMSTLRLLQIKGKGLQPSSVPKRAKDGQFGTPWDEQGNLASQIPADLDEFLMSNVLTLLPIMCREEYLSFDLPFDRELLTLFTEIKTLGKNPSKPVSWSLAFAVHALLTGVLEVQGNDDVRQVGKAVQSSLEQYERQMKWVQSKIMVGTGPFAAEPKFRRYVAAISAVPNIVRPQQWSPDWTAQERVLKEQMALWNPLCAGNFSLFLMYSQNLHCGLPLLNDRSQLRIVLHLFNAFQKRTSLLDEEEQIESPCLRC